MTQQELDALKAALEEIGYQQVASVEVIGDYCMVPELWFENLTGTVLRVRWEKRAGS